jgi:surface carbohydrate biosynthesis protein
MSLIKINQFFKKKFYFNLDFLTKKKILIYTFRENIESFEFIKKKFKDNLFFVFVNEYNLLVIILAYIKLFFSKNKNFFHNYIKILANFSKAKLLISNLDNYTELWMIKKNISNLKVLLIQNGARGNITDIFKNLKKNKSYEVDDFVLFNKNIKKKYQKFVQSNYHILGSLNLANFLKKLGNKKNKRKFYCSDIIYVSQYKKDLEKQIFSRDKLIINFLDKFCLKNNLIFKINFREKKHSYLKYEKNYYKYIGISEKKFLTPRNHFESYRNIINSRLITTFNSSMGYESLSIKKKTFFLPISRSHNPNLYDHFGWPEKVKKDGFYWMKLYSEKILKKKLTQILKCSKKSWVKKISPNYKNIFYQNYQFLDKINNIISKHLTSKKTYINRSYVKNYNNFKKNIIKN